MQVLQTTPNGKTLELSQLKDYGELLRTRGNRAYVRRIARDFGPQLARSRDLQLFGLLRQKYASGDYAACDRLFVRIMSRFLSDDLQKGLIKELPKEHRRDVELWHKLPQWARIVLRLFT
jgi:hypothetical protein